MFNKLKKHIKHCDFHFEDIYNKVVELNEDQLKDLDIMVLMSDEVKRNSDKVISLEKDFENKINTLTRRFEAWKDIHRENMMLLMEYLGVYLDVENDKKVIKKDKSVKTNKKK